MIGLDHFKINYIPRYLKPATARISSYLPDGFHLNMNDTYGIQEICAYEVAAFGESDFCSLFTLAEWEGFQYSTDLAYYGDYSVRPATLTCCILRLRSLYFTVW
jgi:hypothetical protein